ncbi:E3 ubiquitin-protein ligase RNF13-like isoform X2 [Mytilus trossulus]|uniref:E3 ubiquitin-protein ligase RNF13-like isoform X2 n=1 Tax=Mytilus trossulus TaxID=6551 RepID=UPI003004591D
MVTVRHTIIFIELIISVIADVDVGNLVYLKTNKTCHDYVPNRPTEKENETLIALMEINSDCTFLYMVLAAQRMEFDAVIVHNDFQSGEDLGRMISTSDSKMEDVMIPSVLVGYRAGKVLRNYDVEHEAANKDNHWFITIGDDAKEPTQYETTSKILFRTALCITMLFVCPLIIGVCCCIKHSRNKTSVNRYLERARTRRRPSPFHLSDIQVLKSCTPQIHAAKFKKGHRYDTCPICLEEFVENEQLWILPCKHGFHISCIKSWLEVSKHTCPMCKGMVITLPD